MAEGAAPENDPPLADCPCCKQPAQYYSRWQMVGSGPPRLVYYWASCQGTPPCLVGNNYNDPRKCADAWNKGVEKWK